MSLDQDLDSLRPAETIDRLLRAISSQRNVESDRRHAYVSIRPTPVGAIALYALPSRVSIAMEPQTARTQVLRIPKSKLEFATTATTYLLVEEAEVEASYEVVLEMALKAVDWRISGPPLTLGSRREQSATRPRKTCPIGNQAITPSGACGCGPH